MTSVRLLCDGDARVGFEVSGHAGQAAYGSDVVCAAITGAVRYAECALTDVMGLKPQVRSRPGFVSVKVCTDDARREGVRVVLTAFEKHLRALSEEYPQYLSM